MGEAPGVDGRAAVRRAFPWFVIAGVLTASLSLRGPIVSPTPVLRDIEADLGITGATAGLLTTAPVLMFALLTPLAAIFVRRTGAETALLVSLSGVLLGTVIRSVPDFGFMLAGMVVIGASITIGNVVIPVIIRRDVPPERVAVVTAAYTATMNVGSLLTSSLTAPLASLIGWSWALLAWSSITIAGIVLWGMHLARSRRQGEDAERYSGDLAPSRDDAGAASALDINPATITGPLPVVASRRAERSMMRRPVTWLLVASFGLQSFLYYGLSTWMPAIASDELGVGPDAAGALASIYQGAGIAGAFVVPFLARWTPRLVPPTVVCISWVVLGVGLLAAPELLALWLAIGAIGHAGGFVVIFSALVAVARSDSEAAGLSAFVQGGGYVVAAAGGPLFGLLHDLSGSWTPALVLVLALVGVYSAVLIGASVAAMRSGPRGGKRGRRG
ncbi:CynX/NimT family MFS transporter [Microbacterium sp. AK009]|uniref:MFS transporter n=1 Tax=Microbacterium sp. AK009 TaxID=2723068 RepID=UPI001C548487|nr:MFS transporter [Microbacterium sp. AK009]